MADSDTSQALARIEKKLEEVEAAQKSKSTIGIAAPIILVVITVIMIYYALSPLINLYNDREKVTDQIVKEAQETLVPQLEAEVKEFIQKDVVPAYRTALTDIVDTRGPEIIEIANAEAEILYNGISVELETQVTSFIENFSEQQYEKLLEIYPELTALDDTPDPTNPDLKKSQMIVNAMKDATERLTNEMFDKHYKALDKMEIEFNRIEVPGVIDEMNDEELKGHIADTALDLVMYKLDADYGVDTEKIYTVLEGVEYE